MSTLVDDYTVELVPNIAIKEFVKKWHYSKTSPNGTMTFGLFKDNNLVGAAIFGQVIGRHQAKFYFPEFPNRLIELRRLCCIDDTPKNTESFFISRCLNYIRINTDMFAVLSLADQNYEHTGVIYQASNFIKIGEDMDKRPRIFISGVEKHPRYLYDIHGTSSIPALKEIYREKLTLQKKKPKIVYMYKFSKKLKKYLNKESIK